MCNLSKIESTSTSKFFGPLYMIFFGLKRITVSFKRFLAHSNKSIAARIRFCAERCKLAFAASLFEFLPSQSTQPFPWEFAWKCTERLFVRVNHRNKLYFSIISFQNEANRIYVSDIYTVVFKLPTRIWNSLYQNYEVKKRICASENHYMKNHPLHPHFRSDGSGLRILVSFYNACKTKRS